MIYVTHDQVEAMTLGDRIAVMDRGQLQQLGRPTDIYERPGQPVRRDLHRQPADEHPHARRRRPGRCPRRRSRSVCGRRRCRRPGDGEGHAVEIGVDIVEPLGNETVVHGSLASGQKVIARLGPRVVPSPGDRMRLAFDRGDVHLFDAAGARIS